MAGRCVCQRCECSVDHDESGGRSDHRAAPSEYVRHSIENVCYVDAIDEKCGDHSTNQRHVGCRGETVSDNVADHQGDAAIVEDDTLVPVAANGCGCTCGKVAGSRLETGHGRQRSEQAQVKIADELMLGFVDLGALDNLCTQLCECLQRLVEAHVEWWGDSPRESESADR